MVDLWVGKKDDLSPDELALRELGEFLRFPLDPRRFPVEYPSYFIVALSELPPLRVNRTVRDRSAPNPTRPDRHPCDGLCERGLMPQPEWGRVPHRISYIK